MWAIMMVAMMVPSAAPMILLHARIDRGSAHERRAHSAIFVATYLLVWGGFSALAATAQAALVALGVVDAMRLSIGSRVIAAALMAVAALYQLSSAKRACLEQCRAPLLFVSRYWRPGTAGAVRLGLAHGLYCLGCCWGLMLLLFVGGVMNLAWVALLALVVSAEKLSPPGWRVTHIVAAALIAGAAGLLLL
jgi:predicted metal-binding membrane protein